jgi:hypothetical protein
VARKGKGNKRVEQKRELIINLLPLQPARLAGGSWLAPQEVDEENERSGGERKADRESIVRQGRPKINELVGKKMGKNNIWRGRVIVFPADLQEAENRIK